MQRSRHTLTLALVASIVLFALLYAALDYVPSEKAASHFSGIAGEDKYSFGTKLYFSIMTQATVGVGDVVPRTAPARFLVSAQALTTIFFVLYFVSYADSFQVRQR